MRRMPLLLVAAVALGAGPRTARAGDPSPLAWTVRVVQRPGAERRAWHLVLVTREHARTVDLLIAPCIEAGGADRVGPGARVERSASGDHGQVASWAARLAEEARGWKRPSLRERPPASAHVLAVVRSVRGVARVDNAEHGGGPLAVGDMLCFGDVVAVAAGGTAGVELAGPEDAWHHRPRTAALVLGGGARLGLGGTIREPRLTLQAGSVAGTVDAPGPRILVDGVAHEPTAGTTLWLSAGPARRLAVREGTVRVLDERAEATCVVAGGASVVRSGGEVLVGPLDEGPWEREAPREAACAPEEARRIAARACGRWRGQPLDTSLILRDDGTWASHERHPGRSVTRAGTWEPRPGGLVELAYEEPARRGRPARTVLSAWLLEGEALVRLRPGGPVLLRAELPSPP